MGASIYQNFQSLSWKYGKNEFEGKRKDSELFPSPCFIFSSPKGTTLELFVKDYRDMISAPTDDQKEILEAVSLFMAA